MSDDELKDLCQQLVDAVATRCRHIIHADDPIVAVAVMLQVIAGNMKSEQKRLLDDFTKNILAGSLKIQANAEEAALNMLTGIHANIKKLIDAEIRDGMNVGAGILQDAIRAESAKALASLRIENTAIRNAKTTAHVALAAAALAFMGGLATIIALTLN